MVSYFLIENHILLFESIFETTRIASFNVMFVMLKRFIFEFCWKSERNLFQQLLRMRLHSTCTKFKIQCFLFFHPFWMQFTLNSGYTEFRIKAKEQREYYKNVLHEPLPVISSAIIWWKHVHFVSIFIFEC